MQCLSLDEFNRLTFEAEVLSRDLHGDKVLQTSDGTIYKLFRLKRKLSSATIVPYATRFAKAAHELKRRDVRSIEVKQVFRVKAIKRDVVVYEYLEGKILREAIADASRRDGLLDELTRFLASLHAKGIYFRGMHFANLLVLPEGGLGLIDVSETRFRRGKLGPRLRARNLKHMLRYQEDIQAMQAFGLDRFLARYIENSALSPRESSVFLSAAGRSHALIADAVKRLKP
ncbi:MAG: toluene tolerance protein [Planctomycetota bacterium]|nr:toluene tolerance protein [Planctomycetota bacterium]